MTDDKMMMLDGEDWELFYCPCHTCKHFKGDRQCAAFAQIPAAIWEGKNLHLDPYPGDNGIQYEAKQTEGDNGYD